MNYPVPQYTVAAPATKTSAGKIGAIVIGVIVGLFIIIAVVAIALGVGLGVGLKKNSDSSSSSSSSSVLTAPTVSCTYSASTCGCSSTKPSFLSSRIINGYTAISNSWPWMVALYINSGKVFCGGFLVSYQHVITAAHCLNGMTASTVIAYAGLQTLSSRTTTGQSRTGSVITVHPSYSTSSNTNDIAILTLQSAFNQATTIGYCCLNYDTSVPSVGTTGVLAGWGVTVSTGTVANDNLLQGVIQVQSSSTSCSTTTTSSIQFCAGYNGTDACFGDSGSPFMIALNNAYTCAGVVSSGRSCGTNSYYTRVSAYQSFITGVINGKR